jgi:hypothetical protein
LEGNRGRVFAALFSPDGSYLATGGDSHPLVFRREIFAHPAALLESGRARLMHDMSDAEAALYIK